MTKRKRLSFRDVRPPRIPSMLHWKPGARQVPDEMKETRENPADPPKLELLPADDPAHAEAETPEDIELDVKRLLSWPIVAPRDDPPGHTIGLREV